MIAQTQVPRELVSTYINTIPAGSLPVYVRADLSAGV
jgi:hypothetical protein